MLFSYALPVQPSSGCACFHDGLPAAIGKPSLVQRDALRRRFHLDLGIGLSLLLSCDCRVASPSLLRPAHGPWTRPWPPRRFLYHALGSSRPRGGGAADGQRLGLCSRSRLDRFAAPMPLIRGRLGQPQYGRFYKVHCQEHGRRHAFLLQRRQAGRHARTLASSVLLYGLPSTLVVPCRLTWPSRVGGWRYAGRSRRLLVLHGRRLV